MSDSRRHGQTRWRKPQFGVPVFVAAPQRAPIGQQRAHQRTPVRQPDRCRAGYRRVARFQRPAGAAPDRAGRWPAARRGRRPRSQPFRTTTRRTCTEPGQEILRPHAAAVSNVRAPALPVVGRNHGSGAGARLHGVPEVIGHDAKILGRNDQPLGRWAIALLFLARRVALLRFVPDPHAAVEVPPQNFVHRGRRPPRVRPC
jgi:hypothetical protein